MGKIATNILASGNGWSVADAVCTSGPNDRPFEEQHCSISIAVVVEGSFQYRSAHGSHLMSTGSLMLGNAGQTYECSHEHGTGDRCLAFQYTPEFFERCRLASHFPIHRIPPIAPLASCVTEARLAIDLPGRVSFEELAYRLVEGVAQVSGKSRQASRPPTPSDERRVSAALRFIEANLAEPLRLDRLAFNAKMSEFHFLRVFKQVTGVTPHQYILRSRLREAALRLRKHSNEVLEVALDTGFPDLSNFNHAFRSEFGVSPARFRGGPTSGAT